MVKPRLIPVRKAFPACVALLCSFHIAAGAQNQVLGWINLGMHRVDSDYSVVSASLGSSAHWIWVTNTADSTPNLFSITLPASGNEFFRVHRPW